MIRNINWSFCIWEFFISIRQIYADNSTSMSAFKKNPMAVMKPTEGAPVAVLNRNQLVFYCIPADAYKVLMGKLEDIELADIVRQRQSSPKIEVSLDLLSAM